MVDPPHLESLVTRLVQRGLTSTAEVQEAGGLQAWMRATGFPAAAVRQLQAEAPLRLGRYAITGRLGKGGMGLVLRGHDPTLARDVALKLERAIPCERVGVAVIGLEVPHAHVHLIPLNGVADINFERPKLQFSQDELATTAVKIRQA